jgi:hypothetical protein
VAFLFARTTRRRRLIVTFLDTLKAVCTTVFLAGAAAVLTVLAQRSAIDTVQCLQQPTPRA